ncbi:hypothetical protein ANN_14279 [Periplaneta americana]|uniref:Uncharacterized protein n=1 Tax=Periplaneta americana TaxID=6978 RepID=A0ABQ8SXC4_PERAM|nr:hypothetical protein ANN_14279 [Periplaneta americana]
MKNKGGQTVFIEEQELQLKSRILRLAARGFPLTCGNVRAAAYRFAEANEIKSCKFSKEKIMAGWDCFQSFKARHSSELTLRKQEGLSAATTEGLNQKDAGAYFREIIRNYESHNATPSTLNRVFFKPLKTYYDQECDKYMQTHEGDRKITKFNCGKLLNSASIKAATVSVAQNRFRSTGISPLNANVVEDHEFLPSTTVNIVLGNSQSTSGSSSSVYTTPSSSAAPADQVKSPRFDELLPTPKKAAKRTVASCKQVAILLTIPEFINLTKEMETKKNKNNGGSLPKKTFIR